VVNGDLKSRQPAFTTTTVTAPVTDINAGCEGVAVAQTLIPGEISTTTATWMGIITGQARDESSDAPGSMQ